MFPRASVSLALFVLATLVAPTLWAAAPKIDLLTIGEGAEISSRYGHSLLCVTDGETKTARCFDYGLPQGSSDVGAAVDAIRGREGFHCVEREEPTVLRFFKDQGRSIDRRRLPISEPEAEKLLALLERDVKEKRPYSYHPYFANCTTMVRDRIDEATSGRLALGRSVPVVARFREIVEDAHTGHLGELLLMAITLGSPNERVPTAWEAMFLPRILAEAVEERFGVKPTRVSEQRWKRDPPSHVGGRVMLFVISFALVFANRLLVRGRTKYPRASRFTIGFVLGGMGLVPWLAAALVVWPEVQRNWTLVLLLPTDLAIPYLSPRRLAPYLKLRLGSVVLLVFLELVGVVAQPLIPIGAAVFLPLLALLRDKPRDSVGGNGDTKSLAASV